MTQSAAAVRISKVCGDRQGDTEDAVAVEEPLEIRLGFSTPGGRDSRSISVTMRTPGDDEALAAGFLFTESIIRRKQDIALIAPCGQVQAESELHNVVRVELEEGVPVDLERLQRHFYTSSSCGVCGKASLQALAATGAAPLTSTTTFARTVLTSVPEELQRAQSTFERTGGLHAAGAFDSDGTLLLALEDVGRHNAVDKVVGRLLLDDRLPASDLGLIVSGRASFELAQKALVAGMPLLAAVSAPSSLAVSLAREFNLTLVGFLRDDTFNIYAGQERITA
jgi:FdhD protein